MLTEYFAGIRPAKGLEGYGYKNWIMDPTAGLKVGLKRARASVVTASRGSLDVEWELEEQRLSIMARAPRGTSGALMGFGDIATLGVKSLQGESELYNVKPTWP